MKTTEPFAKTTAQLVLALVEVARIERHIRDLESRALDDADQQQIETLRTCRAALLRIASRRIPPTSGALSA